MKTQIKQPKAVSHTIQSKTKAANQASVESVLQKYAQSIERGKLNGASVQRQANEELDEELLQGKFETAQLEAFDEDEEPLQGKFDVAQREEIDDDELLQGKFETTQREENPTPNLTGIPDQTKENFENMSGFSFDDVRVHYNSDKPAQLQALAYTQGNEVHIAPGQEKHLGHELGHVVQQKQGRVQPTMQLQGVNVNDNEGLEREADVMGEISTKNIVNKNMINKQEISTSSPLQRKVGFEFETGWDLFEYTGTETPLPQRKDITDDKQVRLEKNKYWFEGTNFKICADPYPNKNAIEFVTDPMNSLDEVATTMDGIRTKTDQLVGKISGEYFIHDEGGKKFYIKPDDDNMTAVPQVSFGIQLNQLPKMLDFSDSFNNTERKKNNLKESMDKINPADRASSSIDGVCYLIKRYIEDGKEYKYEYPKQITDGAILARTEFGKLLSLAVKKDGKSLINTKDSNYFPIDNWLDLFKDKYKSDQLLFAKDVESDGDEESLKDGEIYAKDLTINDWLKSIYEAAIDDTKQDKLTQVKDHEGLGALGKKTETVAGEEAGIFESRLHAPRSIPHTEWTEYAENWTKFVAKMTGADEQSLDKKKKGCYLTTACVDYMGLPDDCEELTVLRNFRDTYLINKENGKELINIYYEQAPVILLNIHNRYREEEEKILLGLYSIIKDCVNAIKQGNNEYAFGIYCDMVFKLHQQYGNY